MTQTLNATFETINPATGEVLESFVPYDDDELDAILDRATAAQRAWRETTFAERGAALRNVAAVLRENKTQSRGIRDPRDGQADRRRRSRSREVRVELRLLRRERRAVSGRCAGRIGRLGELRRLQAAWHGACGHAVELSLLASLRFAAPALMAGNVAVLKHASNVSRCALESRTSFARRGFPPGVFATVIVPGAEVTQLIDDPRIAAVTLTGSEAAGVQVATACRRRAQEDRARTGRLGRVHRARRRRLATAAKSGGEGAFPERRPELHRAKRFIVEGPRLRRLRRTVRGASARRSSSAIRERRDTKSGRWRAPTCATTRELVAARGGRRPRSRRAATRPTARELFTIPPSSSTSTERCRCSAKRRSGRRRRSIFARDADHAVALANDSSSAWAETLDADIERAKSSRDGSKRRRVHQRHDRLGSAASVRRREAQRLRARALLFRDSRVHEHPNRLDRPAESRGQPKPASE